MPKINERLRMLIVGKMQDCSSLRKVSRELNICKTSVRNIWNKFRDTGSIVDKIRSGRPPKCSVRDTILLSRNAKKEPFLSAHNLGVQSNLISTVSVRTLGRFLHKSSLSARVRARKPLLSKLQVKRRIQWSKAYSSFEATDWNQVIFRTNQGSAPSVVHGVMFGDREIVDTTTIIPARQLNMEAYHCWFGGQLEVITRES